VKDGVESVAMRDWLRHGHVEDVRVEGGGGGLCMAGGNPGPFIA